MTTRICSGAVNCASQTQQTNSQSKEREIIHNRIRRVVPRRGGRWESCLKNVGRTNSGEIHVEDWNDRGSRFAMVMHRLAITYASRLDKGNAERKLTRRYTDQQASPQQALALYYAEAKDWIISFILKDRFIDSQVCTRSQKTSLGISSSFGIRSICQTLLFLVVSHYLKSRSTYTRGTSCQGPKRSGIWICRLLPQSL